MTSPKKRIGVAVLVASAALIGAACSSAPAKPSDPVLAQGYDVFNQKCQACHGPTGEGITAPALRNVANRLTADQHINTVTNGRQGTAMIAWKDQLSADQIAAVVRYEREVISPLG